MKISYLQIIAFLSFAFIGTMISGCGDTSEEYLTPNLPDQTTLAEQAIGIDDDEERPVDPIIRLSTPSSTLYVGSQFQATIVNHDWTIERVTWKSTGARLVSSGYNHNTTWQIESATRPVVLTAFITCRFNNVHQTVETSVVLPGQVLPAPRISGSTTTWVNQPTTYSITGLAQNHTYSWANELYNYEPIVNNANKSITLTFPRIQAYLLTCTVKDQNGIELLTVSQSVDVRQSNPGGGDHSYIPGDVDPGDLIPDWNKRP